MPSSARQLVAAHAAAAAARARASRAPRPSARAPARGGRRGLVGLAPAGGEPVGAGEQRHLDLHGLGAAQVAVDLARGRAGARARGSRARGGGG